jgi:hypothetical protein
METAMGAGTDSALSALARGGVTIDKLANAKSPSAAPGSRNKGGSYWQSRVKRRHGFDPRKNLKWLEDTPGLGSPQ